LQQDLAEEAEAVLGMAFSALIRMKQTSVAVGVVIVLVVVLAAQVTCLRLMLSRMI
jgi:hypothetical protein